MTRVQVHNLQVIISLNNVILLLLTITRQVCRLMQSHYCAHGVSMASLGESKTALLRHLLPNLGTKTRGSYLSGNIQCISCLIFF